jgi:transcriptional regulator with XRE-family HTH domain
MPTGKQIRAARVLVDWEAQTLAKKVGLSRNAILQIERGEFRGRPKTLEKIVQVFAKAGVEFTENEGVCRRPEGIETFEGHERFHAFSDFIYAHVKQYGGDICISAVDERLFQKYRREPEAHRARMKELVDSGDVKVRILAEQSSFQSSYAEFRHSPHKSTVATSFYAFGQCFALISFTHANPPYVVMHKFSPFAETFRLLFNDAWDKAEVVK